MACVGWCKNTCIIAYIITSLAVFWFLAKDQKKATWFTKLVFIIASLVTLSCALRWASNME